MKNIFLVIGSGAREHAIIKALYKSSQEKNIFCLATNFNPGIAELVDEIYIDNINDPKIVLGYAIENKVSLAIIGPENPLENGVTDLLEKNNIGVVGPKKNLAKIESSKSFTRKLLKDFKIFSSPKFKTFSSIDGVDEFLIELGNYYVVKYDGLAGGKGVKVSGEHLHSHQEAIDYCLDLIKLGGKFVVEEKLIGQEFSLMSFCDGHNVIHMPIVQDHKRAYENDEGPNTGGMGTYSDVNHSLPFLTKDDIINSQNINESVSKALFDKFKVGYKGILYGGFIATKEGVQVIEYNARFGDPEAMNVLCLLETDFIDICKSIVSGTLNKINVVFSKKATVCKYVVPNGYPDNPIKNRPINIQKVLNPDLLYYASVDIKNGLLVEAGSRTIAVVAASDTIANAEKIVEKNILVIEGPLFHRQDIGKDDTINKRIKNMKSIR